MPKPLLKNKSQTAGALYAAAITLFLIVSLIGGAILSFLPNGSFARTAVSPLFAVLALSAVNVLSEKAYGAALFSEEKQKDNPCGNFGQGYKAEKSENAEQKLLPKEILGYKKFSPVYVFAAIAVAAGVFCGLGFINAAFANLLGKIGVTIPQTEIEMHGAGEYLVLSLTLAALPAIAEESFFRGAIFYGQSGEKLFSGAALSGFIFALYHCSLVQLIYQFFYGAILYILVKKSGSVFPAVIAHFLNNFAVITLTYFGAEINLFSPTLIAAGVALLVLAFAVIYTEEGRKKGKKYRRKEGNFGIDNVKNNEKAATENVVKVNENAVNATEKAATEKFSVKDFFLPFGIIGALACAVTGAAFLL